MMSFDGKVVLITGASSGIGAATARWLGARGAKLALTGRKSANLQAVAQECGQSRNTATDKNSAETLCIVADVAVESDVRRIIDETVARFGGIDVLINNAGIVEMGSIESTSLEQYDRIMGVNSRAVYHLTMLAAPFLVKSRGNIVNVSSVNGIRSFPNVLAYNISKSSVDAMTRTVALELAPKGVRVNSVNPGVIVTEIHRRGGLDEDAYAKFLEHSKTTHALGRVGHADEVAAAIAFLASDQASFVTGVSLPVDGGRHAMCSR